MTDRLWRWVVPPYRILDPALRNAETSLATVFADVWAVLPDESTAACRLNRLLTGATLRVVPWGGSWRIVVAEPVPSAAAALAVVAVTGGWHRLKRCTRCGRTFVDRTNGATRRGCADHPARRR